MSSARIVQATDRETIVQVGNGPLPGIGFTGFGDLARLCAHSGRLRVGFSGEDSFNETGVRAMATQLFQKMTSKSAAPAP